MTLTLTLIIFLFLSLERNLNRYLASRFSWFKLYFLRTRFFAFSLFRHRTGVSLLTILQLRPPELFSIASYVPFLP